MFVKKKTLHTCDYDNKLTEEDLTVCFVARPASSSILNIRTKGIIPSVYEVNQILFKTTRNTCENKDDNVVMHFIQH